MGDDVRTSVAAAITEGGGILNLDPAWVARSFLPAGRRLGLAAGDYDAGERGTICERWLASTTHADNAVGPPGEGISAIRTRAGRRIDLASAVAAAGDLIMGTGYAASHAGLGRLAKIFDYAARLPYHVHPPLAQARLVGRNPKDEAYYWPPNVPMGPHPETFFGLHPSLARERVAGELVAELVRWDSDTILRFSRAYQQLAEDGFLVPSGVLHAPGTALTIELQEDSDTLAMLQALNAGQIIDKELLFKDISEAARREHGEAAVLDWIDWPRNTDPYFYEHHHTPPVPLREGDGVREAWIFYGSPKFSGKRLYLAPGTRDSFSENGVYSLLVWQGAGTVGGVPVAAGDPAHDELLVTHDRAVTPVEVVNTGPVDLLVVKMFGPDLNPEAPEIGRLDADRYID